MRLARIVSIFFTAYIHAWPGAGGVRATAPLADMEWVSVVFIDWLGRGAVPLLSIVSGMLVWYTLAGRAPLAFLTGKLRTLLVPMVIWNAVMLMVVAVAVAVGLKHDPPDTAWYNWLFALTDEPLNRPLGFLRDVFVCMLLAPMLHLVLCRAPLPGVGLLVAIAVFGYVSADMALPLFLRPAIFAMFAVGLVLVRFDLVAAFSRPALGLVAIAGLVAVDLLARGAFRTLDPDVLNLLRRALIATVVWQACVIAIRHAGARRLLWIERTIFFFFCTHLILFSVLGIVASRVLTDPLDPVYWAYFLFQPVLGLGITVAAYMAAARWMPRLLALSTGQRTRARPAAQHTGPLKGT